MREHYGLTDQKEFFAEMTECYFGSNDFYPFVTGELKQAEPELFVLLADISCGSSTRSRIPSKTTARRRSLPRQSSSPKTDSLVWINCLAGCALAQPREEGETL
jgi:hypothetical protein